MIKEDCIFCKLANGEIPTNTLYEDELVRVIFDLGPATKGHVLVIPKARFQWMKLQRRMFSRLRQE